MSTLVEECISQDANASEAVVHKDTETKEINPLALEADDCGRFNLNAVHHHFGADASKKVSAWVKMKCTQQLIEMAQLAKSTGALAVIDVVGPKHRPTTFVSDLLLLNYAAWHGKTCYAAVQAALSAYRSQEQEGWEPLSEADLDAIEAHDAAAAPRPEAIPSPMSDAPVAQRAEETMPVKPEIRFNPALASLIQAEKKVDAPVLDFVRKIFAAEASVSSASEIVVETHDGRPFLTSFALSSFVEMPHVFVRQFVDVYRSNFESLGDILQCQHEDESGYRLNESQALLLVSYLPAGSTLRQGAREDMDLRVRVIRAFDAHRAPSMPTSPGLLARHLRAAAEWMEAFSEREDSFKATIALLQDQVQATHAERDHMQATIEQLTTERDQAFEKASNWIATERAQYHEDPQFAGLSLSQAAKTLGWKPMAFMDWLEDNKWAFRRQPAMPLEPYQERIDQGFMIVKMTTFEDKAGEQMTQPSARVTLKGLDYLKTVL